MGPALSCRKRYRDVVAVDDVSFTVERGEIFGILGSNGVGKTTTVETIEGCPLRTAAPSGCLGWTPQRDGAELRQRVGVQLQERQLPDKLNVAEALEEVMPAVLRRTGDFARSAPACRPLQDATTGAWSRPLHLAVLAAVVPIAASVVAGKGSPCSRVSARG